MGLAVGLMERTFNQGFLNALLNGKFNAGIDQLVKWRTGFDVAEAMMRVIHEVRDHTFEGRVFAFDLGSGVLDVVVNPALAPDTRLIAEGALEEARAEITAGLVEFDGLGL